MTTPALAPRLMPNPGMMALSCCRRQIHSWRELVGLQPARHGPGYEGFVRSGDSGVRRLSQLAAAQDQAVQVAVVDTDGHALALVGRQQLLGEG